MFIFRLLLLGFLCVASGCSLSPSQVEDLGEDLGEDLAEAESDKYFVERLDPELDQLISSRAEIEILAEGFSWSEGPLWLPQTKELVFSDVPNNTIHSWSERAGLKQWLQPSGCTWTTPCPGQGSNGLLLDANGRLVLAQHGDRRMARMLSSLDEPASRFSTLVAGYQGKRFNSPNDAAYDGQGNLFFTDPPYGLAEGEDDPKRELDFQGVFMLSDSGELSLIDDQLSRPNGIALAPDHSVLYVANSDPNKAIWVAYELDTERNVRSRRLIFDATDLVAERPGLPDGLKVGATGHLYATGPGGVLIFSPAGKWLGTVRTPGPTANCAFGNGGKYLYMTSNKYLLRIALQGAAKP